ncbi:K(+)-transporting ATPase subunit C [Flavobacterium silvaticum]|uniref:Potassium-transporting ATPase KdpC subunit n=1 Tax=Flavobacterium silvaticum TaxID=1852020 RepID=A0A972FVH0_9FLAO|nr:K(+)-transporting ATPase subunit C [Flavobacterium silvaticum]NMH28777.1 K(+)-transporting ATPase subunit C [Flavobacterium silvaticum]
MKNLFIQFRLTIILLVLFCGIYPLAVYAIAQFAPNHGKGETVSVDGKVVGYRRIGQRFNAFNYFWGRPSAVDYNAAGSAGSNKGPSNVEYLQQVQKRIDTFLIAHPYLKKSQVPSDMVTASGSGLDPDISAEAALVQVKRVAGARKLDESKVRQLVESKIYRPVIGTVTVNVLELNLALDELK